MSADLELIIRRLAERMARAEVVLFTGAGFSYGATDRDGDAIPQVDALKREIWELTWPGEAMDDDATLADTYAAALAEGQGRPLPRGGGRADQHRQLALARVAAGAQGGVGTDSLDDDSDGDPRNDEDPTFAGPSE